MIAAFYGYASALLLVALVAEAHTSFLIWVGIIQAFWLVIASSMIGYRATRDQN